MEIPFRDVISCWIDLGRSIVTFRPPGEEWWQWWWTLWSVSWSGPLWSLSSSPRHCWSAALFWFLCYTMCTPTHPHPHKHVCRNLRGAELLPAPLLSFLHHLLSQKTGLTSNSAGHRVELPAVTQTSQSGGGAHYQALIVSQWRYNEGETSLANLLSKRRVFVCVSMQLHTQITAVTEDEPAAHTQRPQTYRDINNSYFHPNQLPVSISAYSKRNIHSTATLTALIYIKRKFYEGMVILLFLQKHQLQHRAPIY